ncbi:MAG: transporter substrate-binding domain-containing protein [Granulosicoccus sp.]
MLTDAPQNIVRIGVLFSLHGPYESISNELFKGAMLAVHKINQSTEYSFSIEPVVRDPGGSLDGYRTAAVDLLTRQNVSHVVGCYTSSSRKEVIPVFEKYDGLLWYPSHYEGYESCSNVIYTGASPNQYLVPLLSHMLAHYGHRIYCVGSNYIWSWENNRTARALAAPSGAEILSERYVNVGSTDVAHIIDEILRVRPSFVFSSLIGTSSHEFIRQFALANAKVSAPPLPICSATISEPELRAAGPQAASNIITSSVYFQSIDSSANDSFVRSYKARYGDESVTSEDAEAAYIAVMLLAKSIESAGTAEVGHVKTALHQVSFAAPQGLVRIDPATNHCFLTACVGRSEADGQFTIIWSAGSAMKPDPYMLVSDIAAFRSMYGVDTVTTSSSIFSKAKAKV